MAIHNITDSALLVKKSRRTIQRYIANGKLTMVANTLGKPQIDTTELIRVFGALSKVSLKKIDKKSQHVTVKSSKKNNIIKLTHDELEDIITRAVEKALSKAIPLLVEHKKTAPIPAVIPAVMPEPITSMASVAHTTRKPALPTNRPFIAKKKERKNGYAAAFGLPNVITEVIHLQIMKLHGEGLTSREIEKEVNISQTSIQRTINVST
ncbi:hypothetical protein [Colwellia psychrerythraea]|uniref:Helix-turn-helix domain-containing protein n=1 Tax=Colwellia psychrerythraea TaxID=28229 RepID=A0A099KHU7_COLPS|nr:hypothetical protein [Colwellia psychrerythraea]KGJ90389.1 hypothetical protein GAB14E_3632 [Colwellia psychrerythraea]